MNKFSAVALTSVMSIALGGCSAFKLSEDCPPWPEASTHIPSDGVEHGSNSDSEAVSSDAKADEPEGLSKYSVDSLPLWMTLEYDGDSSWSSFKLRQGQSFSSSLSQKGYETSWLRSLRRADFFDLTTIYDGQVVWVEEGPEGALATVYTSPNSGLWYHISLGDNGPVVDTSIEPVDRSSTLVLSPDTPLHQMSDTQKAVASTFLREIKSSMDHDVTVMLSKGDVAIHYDFTQITPSNVGNIKITRATAKFSGHVLVYVPEST